MQKQISWGKNNYTLAVRLLSDFPDQAIIITWLYCLIAINASDKDNRHGYYSSNNKLYKYILNIYFKCTIFAFTIKHYPFKCGTLTDIYAVSSSHIYILDYSAYYVYYT